MACFCHSCSAEKASGTSMTPHQIQVSKKIISPQIQWYSTSETLRFALAPGWLSQYILKQGVDRWCHTKGGLRVDKENAVPLLLVCGDPGKAPYQIQKTVRCGGRQSKQAQLSLFAVLGSSTRFQTMRHHCLSLLGHKACVLTALILCQCCPRKTQAAERKQTFLAAKSP